MVERIHGTSSAIEVYFTRMRYINPHLTFDISRVQKSRRLKRYR